MGGRNFSEPKFRSRSKSQLNFNQKSLGDNKTKVLVKTVRNMPSFQQGYDVEVDALKPKKPKVNKFRKSLAQINSLGPSKKK